MCRSRKRPTPRLKVRPLVSHARCFERNNVAAKVVAFLAKEELHSRSSRSRLLVCSIISEGSCQQEQKQQLAAKRAEAAAPWQSKREQYSFGVVFLASLQSSVGH